MTQQEQNIRRRELGGPDPLDRRLGARPSTVNRLLSLLRSRSALGLAPSLTPAIIFLPIGVLFGPHALGLLPADAQAALDVAVTLALAVLGILVGLALGRGLRPAPRLFAAASLESLVTIGAVAAATLYFIVRTGVPVGAPISMVALALGLCASASSATSADPDSEAAASVATRVADLDDVLPICLVTAIFVLLPGVTRTQAWMMIVTPALIGLAVGAIGWLLFERADSSGERVVFVLGTLGMIAGASALVQVSPLTSGLVAGLCWTLAPGRADRIIQLDLQKVQHPLVVLLLLAAGASWHPSMASLWLLAPYLLFRLAGKIMGAWASAPLVDARPADLAAFLIPPGVLAIAFALNFKQMLPAGASDILLSTVAMGTAAFELFALAVLPHGRRRFRPAPGSSEPSGGG